MTLRSMRGGKKRRVSCNGRHTGSEFARHESVQTSYWCFGARKVVKLIKQGKANDGLVLVRPWQLTTYGSTLDAAQWLSRFVDATIFTYYTGGSYLNRPSKGLSRMMGNYHVRFLWGNGPQGPDLPGQNQRRIGK